MWFLNLLQFSIFITNERIQWIFFKEKMGRQWSVYSSMNSIFIFVPSKEKGAIIIAAICLQCILPYGSDFFTLHQICIKMAAIHIVKWFFAHPLHPKLFLPQTKFAVTKRGMRAWVPLGETNVQCPTTAFNLPFRLFLCFSSPFFAQFRKATIKIGGEQDGR